MPYDTLPSKASFKPEPFHAHVTDLELEGFKQALRISRLGPKTYENQVANPKDYRSFGINRQWLEESKEHWVNNYDWRKTEDRINSYNNYTVDIEHLGFKFHVHFLALFSKKEDAVPLLLMHGWPGSFLEFLAVVDEFKKKYDEDSLPFHVVVPSLPGYAYSNGPPIDQYV
jgi:pimeloyl-ACP methyl ester carboxylesterase